MNRAMKGQPHLNAQDASKEFAAEPMTRFPPCSSTKLLSFFDPFSTAC